MDAIALLKDDHQKVEGLFKKFESAGKGAHKTKRKLADQIIEELSRHAHIEEEVFYPRARELMRSDQEIVLEALEEHHIVEWSLNELQGMDPKHERFQAKVMVLMENVRHHVKEEERDMFPKIRKAMKPADLRTLGDELQRAKASAPAQPQPKGGRTPPQEVLERSSGRGAGTDGPSAGGRRRRRQPA